MKQSDKMSDEALAAYLEGMFPKQSFPQAGATMDIDTFEVLNVSYKALEELSTGNVIHLPSWNEITKISLGDSFQPLAMAGFLGESSVCDENDDENEK